MKKQSKIISIVVLIAFSITLFGCANIPIKSDQRHVEKKPKEELKLNGMHVGMAIGLAVGVGSYLDMSDWGKNPGASEGMPLIGAILIGSVVTLIAMSIGLIIDLTSDPGNNKSENKDKPKNINKTYNDYETKEMW